MPDQQELSKYGELREIIARLRAPDGCPWDREQTHESLKPFLVQEAYEVLELLDRGDIAAMPEELGDLLFQILIHTQLAEEAGEFTMAHVLEGLADKLVRRHPHVFGESRLETAGQVVDQWDRLKSNERPPEASALQGVPRSLPALAYSQEILRRAASAGFEWKDRAQVLDKLAEEVRELEGAADVRERTEELGDILFNLVNYGRYLGVDAEEALRLASGKFRSRFETVEGLARDSGRLLADMSLDELLDMWQRAKRAAAE
jgi:tetrapyrrole methylase family protein/MazG family protein